MKTNYQKSQLYKTWFLNKKIILTCVIIFSICFTAFINNKPKYKEAPLEIFQNIEKWNGFKNNIDSVVKPKLNYKINANYLRPIKKEILEKASSLKDIIETYPTSWISTYQSVEIAVIVNDKKSKAIGKNEILNANQVNILNHAEIGNEVEIIVHYKAKNPVTLNFDNRTMYVKFTVIPENEAKYKVSEQEMKSYFNTNLIEKLLKNTVEKNQKGIIYFTVNEEGKIEDIRIKTSSKDENIDKLLIETIQNMPKWIPAENKNGEKVKQEFIFNIGTARDFMNGEGC